MRTWQHRQSLNLQYSCFKLRLWVTFLLLAACALLCGCVSYPYAESYVVKSRTPGPSGGAAFSDEVSRDLVRQTRQLIVLKDRDYLVGADDVLEISIFEWEMSEETKTLLFRVSESGVISLPALGPVSVAGKTIQEIQKIIEDELATRNVLQNPRVGVAVKEYRSRRIAVIGEVNAPGVYAIHENVSTLMDMLTLAGGPRDTAGQFAYILRKKQAKNDPLRIAVDLESLFDKGNFELNAVLQGEDVIYVPKAPLVYVYGNVRQPGGFPLRRSMRVLEAIALAGGLSARADKSHCFVVRRDQGTAERVVPLNLTSIERGQAANFFLREGDVVNVPESPGKTIAWELWNVVRGIFTFTYRLDSSSE